MTYMSFDINFLCGFLPVRLSRLGYAQAGYRGFEVRPEARCLAMLFGADQRQRPRVHCMGLDWGSHRDADLTERLRPRDPVVTDIRQPVVGLDGWNVGTLCLVDEPDRAPSIVAL